MRNAFVASAQPKPKQNRKSKANLVLSFIDGQQNILEELVELSSTRWNEIRLGFPEDAESCTERVHRKYFHHDFSSYCFFNFSPKRQQERESVIEQLVPEASRTSKLMDLCGAR